MRNNQNSGRMHGRSNSGRNDGGNNGGNRSGGHHRSAGQHSNSGGGGNSGGNQRRNPRVHTFDSNGPDVRIRGNAYQINEKYVTLARDANSAGDRVLAESYLQHAEHYQRLINEMTEEFGQQHFSQPQQQQQQPQQQHTQQQQHSQQAQPRTHQDHSQAVQPSQPQRHHQQHSQHRRIAENVQPSVDSPDADGLNDLDQSFLVGPRRGLPPREEQPQPVVAQQRTRRQPVASVEKHSDEAQISGEALAEGQLANGHLIDGQGTGEKLDTKVAAPARQPRARYPRPQKEPDAV